MAWSYILLLAFALSISNAQDQCTEESCISRNVALLDTQRTGSNDHYYIGGLFSVHDEGPTPYTCGRIRLRGLVNTEAFFWAIKKYQERVNLSTVKVGGFVMDSCSRSERVIENIYSFETCRTQFTNVDPRNTVAYVGPDRSDDALQAAPLLRDMKRTHVIQAATSPMLSDPSFQYTFRIVPSDAVEMKLLADFLNFKSIMYVQVVYMNSAYGMGLFHAFEEEVRRWNICIIQKSAVSHGNVDDALTMLLGNTVTKYVVLLMDNDGAKQLLLEVDNTDGIQNQFVFVGTSSWGQDTSILQTGAAENAITVSLNTESYVNSGDVTSFWEDFFQMDPDTGSNSGPNVNTYNPWFNEFWEHSFNCMLEQGTCNVTTQDLHQLVTDSDTYVPYTLMAVEAIIRGIKAQANRKCSGDHLCSEMLNRNETGGLNQYEAVAYASNNGQNYFNATTGEVLPFFEKYRVYQIQSNEYKNVLDYDPTQTANHGFVTIGKPAMVMLTSGCPTNPCSECGEVQMTQATTTPAPTTRQPVVTTPRSTAEQRKMILAEYFESDQEFTGVWRNQSRASKDSKTRFENGHDWIIALGVVAGLGMLCVVVFEIYILYKLTGTKIGRQWRSMWLGQLLLFGIFLCYLTLIAFLFTPTKATCGITRFGVGFSYAVCFAVLLVKLMVLLTSKTSADALIPGDVDSPNYLRGIYQFLMFFFVVGVQVVIAVQWLIMVPPEAVQVVSNNGLDHVWICNHYTWSLDQGWYNMSTFVRTDFENHLISLSYVMFLILLTTIVALRAHGIITNHRESVFIGIAAGFTIPVWIAWGLVGGLNKDHEYAEEFGDAAIAFGLAITATIILFAMFLPKVRQLVNMGVEGIYLEDDRDTYYAGSVIMAPPSYKSRPSSVVYVNNGFNDPVVIGDTNAVHLKHPGSNYSAPVYVKRPDSIGHSSGKVLRMTGDLTGKHPRDSRKSTSEAGYAYAGSGYGTYRKSRSESGGGTLRKARSHQDLGAL